MKYFRMFLLTTLLAFALAACGNSHEQADHDHEHDATATEQVETVHGEGPQYTSAYVCPMHCEGSGSDQPGTCPVCGMTYVAQAEHAADGHHHN